MSKGGILYIDFSVLADALASVYNRKNSAEKIISSLENIVPSHENNVSSVENFDFSHKKNVFSVEKVISSLLI